MTRLEFLKELEEQIEYNISCYSKDIILGIPKDEYKKEFSDENLKLDIVKKMIQEEKHRQDKMKERKGDVK